ncbi:MarR family transcriptional regulator [Desulfovibrio sp. Huiquan2017]|uniref:MarR family winged helix-turn-helix transcriptional regulator n=1 Tax=Desulfovibrio sp. Huiquan2017 TaxID=2816861 RepID=UPI001A92A531|nr:MarR family transcriptional regulator [Desulfovibrio sp. Huiquan2017]
MFFLKDFPDEEMVARLRQVLPTADADRVQIFLRLLVLGSECLSHLDRLLERHGLSHSRWLVLMLLRRREVWRALPSELAREQGITRATMSGLTQRLEKQGLITRQPDDHDKRQTVIVLTPDGASLIERVLPQCVALMEQVLSPLEGNEKNEFKRLIAKLFPLRA